MSTAMLTAIISGDVAVDTRSLLDRHSADYRPIANLLSINRYSVDRAMNHPPSIGRYFADAPRPNVSHMSECRSSSHQVSTTISTDIVVDITYSKHDPSGLGVLN